MEIHMYTIDGKLKRKILRPLKCVHDTVFLLEVSIADRKYLAMSCQHCQNITLVQKGENMMQPILAWETKTKKECGPSKMCVGGPEEILVADCNSTSVMIFDITSSQFNIKRSIDVRMKVDNLCYANLPDVGPVIFTTNAFPTFQVSATAIEHGVLWTLDRKTYASEEGKKWLPKGICIDSEGHLFVADYGNKHIAVIEAMTGHILKIFQPPEIQGSKWLDHVLWCNSQNCLILSHGYMDSKVSLYCVTG